MNPISRASLLPGLAFANVGHAAEFWSDTTRITSIYPHAGGMTFNVQYSNPLSTCGGTRWVVPIGSPNYAAIVASLMLAHGSDKPIQIHVEDQPAPCEPVVDRSVVF